jgi:hypothetical protein
MKQGITPAIKNKRLVCHKKCPLFGEEKNLVWGGCGGTHPGDPCKPAIRRKIRIENEILNNRAWR